MSVLDRRRLLESIGYAPPIPGSEQQDSGIDTFADIQNNQNLIFQIALIGLANKLSQRPEGMKTIQVLGKSLLDGLFDMLDSGAQASAANHISAFAFPVLSSQVLERLALLPPGWNAGFHKSLALISGFDQAAGFIEAIFGKDKGFPGTLAFAKKSK